MISRFCRYLDKLFQWSQRIQALSDPRPKPQISTQSAFLSAMMMSAAGLQSLNALESELRVGGPAGKTSWAGASPAPTRWRASSG